MAHKYLAAVHQADTVSSTFRLGKKLFESAKAAAKEEGVGHSRIFRLAILAYLDANHPHLVKDGE